jgi:CheY-like chemotaxis protein
MNEPKANNSGHRNNAKPLIYVVDDEAMLLELAAVILEPLHYEVRTFRDPELALQSYASATPKPALVITDYAMHKVNGLGLIEACRRIEPTQKALLVSGTVGPEVYLTAPTKPDRFLAKPYQARQLIETVKSLLGHEP